MRTALASLFVAGLVAATGTAGLAHDTGVAINPDETTEIEVQTANVELVAHHYFPEGTDMQFQRREGEQVYDGETITATKDFVFVGGDAKSAPEFGRMHVFDITDPTMPLHVADINCRGYHAEIAVWENYLIQTFDGGNNEGCSEERTYDPDRLDEPGGDGVRIFDITDPVNPKLIRFLNADDGIGDGGSHNATVVPWAGLLYLAQQGSVTPGGAFTIVDLKDPDFPVTAYDMSELVPGGDYHCHDIGLDPVREYAFCAAIVNTHILDISDPMVPAFVTTIFNNKISIHHSARMHDDGNTLILGDEHAGAADQDLPAVPVLEGDAGTGAAGCIGDPTAGALFFYDLSISDIVPPLVGSYAPTGLQPLASPCTSHFYGSVPGTSMIAAGWYEGGILVIDHSAPWPLSEHAVFLPVLGNFWSAYHWHGYVYGLSRTVESKGFGGGLWVIKVEGADEDVEPSPVDEGTVWARWTPPTAIPAPAPAPAPEPEPEVAPAAEELPATGNGFALLSVLLGVAYLGLRRRDGLADSRA